MNWKNVGWGMLAGLFSVHAAAVEPWAPTDAEMASLPPYCKARMKSGQGSPDYKMWEQTLGKDFLHTHHYCAGINFINRYYRARSQQDKNFILNNALGTLTYMVEHASPDYSLMPDVYLSRGLTYSLMKRHGEAMADMQKAIELNPRQVKAYNVLADYYVSTGEKAKALETVTAGLRHNPGTKGLQRRYQELGGKLPYPASSEPEPAEVEVAKPEESSVAPAEKPAETQAAPAGTPSSEAEAPRPQIGSPTNPYCRFCPD